MKVTSRPLLNLELGTDDVEALLDVLEEHKRNTTSISENKLYELKGLLKSKLYVSKLKDFHHHIEKSLPPYGGPCEDDEWDKFYNMPWTIAFNGKSIQIENNAGIYNAMLAAVKEQLDDYI